MGRFRRSHRQPGPRTQQQLLQEELTPFGVVIVLPIFAAILALFPRYSGLNQPTGSFPALLVSVLTLICYLLAGFCLLFAVYGFFHELKRSPQMKRFLKREAKNVLANPLRALFNKSAIEGLQNGSITLLFAGIAISIHVGLITIAGLTGVAELVIKVVILLVSLAAALALAATIDSIAIKPILMNREQRRSQGVDVNFAQTFNQLGKVVAFIISAFSTLVSTSELVPEVIELVARWLG